MTESRYEQFLDEFGAQLRQAAATSARQTAAGRCRGILAHARASVGRSTRIQIVTTSALCVVAAAVALLLIAPWSGSPGYLARAAAAIVSPGPDSILYERWEVTFPSEQPNQPSQTFGPDQLWIEGAAPRRYRLIMQPNAESRTTGSGSKQPWSEYGGTFFGFGGYPYWLEELEAAVAGHPLEVGGELENPAEHAVPPQTFTFTPPDTLWSGRFHAPLGAPLPGGSDTIDEAVADPVTALRDAIAEGRAQEDGTSELEGQRVERLTFNAGRSYALVNSETFKPVVIDFFGYYRFLSYEYLPANAANLALANIQTQHPNANVIADTPLSTNH